MTRSASRSSEIAGRRPTSRASRTACRANCRAASSSAWRWRAPWLSSRRILLLDEPFSALDKSLRLDMQIEIKRLQRQFGADGDPRHARPGRGDERRRPHRRHEQGPRSSNSTRRSHVYDQPGDALRQRLHRHDESARRPRVVAASNGWTAIALDHRRANRRRRRIAPSRQAAAPSCRLGRSSWPCSRMRPSRSLARAGRPGLPIGPTRSTISSMPGGQTLKLAERAPWRARPSSGGAMPIADSRPDARPALFDVTSEASKGVGTMTAHRSSVAQLTAGAAAASGARLDPAGLAPRAA